MNLQIYAKIEAQRRSQVWIRRSLLSVILLFIMMALGSRTTLAQGPYYDFFLQVNSIGDTVGDTSYSTAGTIDGFDYLINVDNSGDPNDPANLPSTALDSHSPVVETGTVATGDNVMLSLEEGSYLITVRVDGHKLGGQWVTLPDDENETITVELINEPLPLSTIQVHIYEDNNSVNGQNDIPIEQAISDGFHVVIEDVAGEVTVDWEGNPLCGGFCQTDANGDLTIEGLPRGKYEVLAIPPNGSDWIQTFTIEGTKPNDAFIEEGSQGLAPSEVGQPIVSVGFVKPMDWGDPGSLAPGTGQIKGTIKTSIEWLPPVSAPAPLGEPVDRPWIALTDIGGNDNQVYTARGNVDGSFQIDNVPDGLYQMTIWDGPLDYIITFTTVSIPNDICVGFGDNTASVVDINWAPDPTNPATCIDHGGYGIPRWFGALDGTVFLDNDQDRLYEPGDGEVPLSGVELLMRFRDGSIRYSTITDNDGYYEFPEIFQLGRFYITEVGFGLLGTSGAYLHNRFPDTGNDFSAHFDGVLTLANLNWAGKRETVDWGKFLYTPGENGGISGIVQYATTRNEFEARIQATEDYEPGIPNVTVNLYEFNTSFDPTALPGAPNSDPRGLILNTTETDAWTQPTGCTVTDQNGDLLTDLTSPLPLGPTCIEAPNLSNEIKDGVFDGGYAFEERYATPGDDTSGFVTLEPGHYVIEVVPPTGYKIVTEEDLNTIDGNSLVPAIPPAGCVGDLYQPQVPDDYDSPFDAWVGDDHPGTTYKTGRENLYMPKCNLKAATLQEGQNKGVDFHLMTDNAVPVPGRIFGVLLDDINVETDPTKLFYGEKKGIAHTSVGIRDHTGRLIKMIESDEHGFYEALVPSTFVADCPIPSGVCPAMYQVVGNDPGDLGNPSPHYNPNYQTRAFWKDVWPGKTTFFDLAVFPISAQEADCTLPETTPDLYYVSTPYGPAGTMVDITGNGFGPSPVVEFEGVDYPVTGSGDLLPNTIDTITVDTTGWPSGPGQLLIKANGETSHTGLTFHVIGGDYTPTVIEVNPGLNAIQLAIDAASDGDLIVVNPGTYFERFDINKRVKLQGYGPGSDYQGAGGSVIDLRFNIGQLGPTVSGVLGNGIFDPQIDGFLLTGSRDDELISGAVKVDMGVDLLRVSNNIFRSNGGGFGGAMTIGEPYRGDNNNNYIRIDHNRILHNGGVFLAGAIGIYNGADDYEIDHNDICGNYSAEYGGGISHHGLSHNGEIHHNRIYFNNSFDEGGGIIIAGELPATPDTLTAGSGAVNIHHNLIQGNIANDDGGGIRTLQPLDYPINITNNMIVNNVSTDLGGGVSLDDTSRTTIVNNTVARNASTATAEDSDGFAHGAGITSEPYSPLFSDHLGEPPGGYPDPVMFNNIICQNQAYTYDSINMVLIKDTPDEFFDLEVLSPDASKILHPTYSLLTNPLDATEDFDLSADGLAACGPLGSLVASPYESELSAIAFRAEPNFVTVYNLTTLGYPTDLGDYHLASASTNADDAGTDVDPLWAAPTLAYPDPVQAPCDDYDNDPRPYGPLGFEVHDIGADEVMDVGDSLGDCVEPGLGLSLSLTASQAIQATVAGGVPLDLALLHTLQNTGGPSDTYDLTISVDLGWAATVDPTTQALNPGESVPVTGTVTIPGDVISGTVATVQITATSQTNPSLTSTVIDTLTVLTSTVVPVPEAAFYLTFEQNNSPQVGSLINVHDEDIIGFDGVGDYVMVFDGSDVGLLGQELDAFDILDDGTILMSLQSGTSVDMDGVLTPIADSDIIRFHPTSYGLNTTAGTFSLYLDGSAVGLTTMGEDIDAITLLEGNVLLISVRGNVMVPVDTTAGGPPWVNGHQDDLLRYEMQDEANPSAGGIWSLYFDGTDIGLSDGGNDEDVNGASIQGEDNLYLTTRSYFWVDNGTVVFNGADEDIFTCVQPGVTPEGGGTNGGNTLTTCGGGFSSLFIGGSFGLSIDDMVGSGRDINGIDIP